MIPKHITDRLSFSNEQLNGPVEWQEYVVFSDESRFCLNRLSSRILIKKGLYNEKSFCKEKKCNKGIMIWEPLEKTSGPLYFFFKGN